MTAATASAQEKQAVSTAADPPTAETTGDAATLSTQDMPKATTVGDGDFSRKDGSSSGQWESPNNARRKNADELAAQETTVLKVLNLKLLPNTAY